MAEKQRDMHVRDFAWYWLGQSASVLSGQVVAFLLPTVAILLFHASSTQVGLLNAASMVAYPALGLLAGVLADRVRRRPIMVVADLARMVAFAWIPVAAVLGVLDLVDLFVVGLAGGVFGVLFDVASHSHLPTLLPTSMLGKANARLELSTSLAMLGGPALGGLLVQLLTGVTALAVAAGLLVLSVLGVLRLRTSEPLPPARRPGARVLGEIREGVAALLNHPLLRPTTIAGALRNLGNAAAGTVALVFAYQVLGLSPGAVGLLLTVSGIASIFGAWLSAPVLSRLGTSRTLIISCASGMVWMAAPLALSLPAIPAYVTVAAMAAFWLPIWNMTITTFRQTVIAPELLGRVHATSRSINFCALPLGALIGGAGADVLTSAFGATNGLSISLVGVGLLAGCGALVLMWVTRRISPCGW